jgi:hypothetical protein
MASTSDPNQDPAITGVPPETPDEVRPSATGLVAGPIDGDTDVEVAEVEAPGRSDEQDAASRAQTMPDAEGRVEGSTLDAPEA